MVSMQDPVADMLTRIRNAQQAKHELVSFPASKLKAQIVSVLKDEGYIHDYRVEGEHCHKNIVVKLKYYQGRAVIEKLKRTSRPGLRIYRNANSMPKVPGFGIAIVTTSQGVMTSMAATSKGIGGEVICLVA